MSYEEQIANNEKTISYCEQKIREIGEEIGANFKSQSGAEQDNDVATLKADIRYYQNIIHDTEHLNASLREAMENLKVNTNSEVITANDWVLFKMIRPNVADPEDKEVEYAMHLVEVVNNPYEEMSTKSSSGEAILGHKVGDEISITLANKEKATIKIEQKSLEKLMANNDPNENMTR